MTLAGMYEYLGRVSIISPHDFVTNRLLGLFMRRCYCSMLRNKRERSSDLCREYVSRACDRAEEGPDWRANFCPLQTVTDGELAQGYK